MKLPNNIQQFLAAPAFGVAGVSTDRNKYGNKVLRAYLQNHKLVYPIHPSEKIMEGVTCLQNIADLPSTVTSLSIITPPKITEKIVEQAISKRIKNIWMQPGAESAAAVKICEENGINVIYGGDCVLVVLRYHE